MSTTLDQAWEQFATSILPDGDSIPPEAQAVYRMIFCAGVVAVRELTEELRSKTEAQGTVVMSQFFEDARSYGEQWVISASMDQKQH